MGIDNDAILFYGWTFDYDEFQELMVNLILELE